MPIMVSCHNGAVATESLATESQASSPANSVSSSPTSSNGSRSLPISNPLSNGTINGHAVVANKPGFKWVIQKFGGTSVGKFADKIAVDIVREYVNQNRVAIVCSARSTDTKAEGTTNRLLRAAREAMIEESKGYLFVVEQIKEDHVREANLLIHNPIILRNLIARIEKECNRLAEFLTAAQILNEISPKSKDVIIGTGEKLSCQFMAALLQDRGVDAEYVNLENILPVGYELKYGIKQEFYDDLSRKFADRIRQCGNRVPVITGFFGYVPGSILEQIGRGYTDLCAALVAVGMDAHELQVWKEVDGIFTADPRKVPNARLLATITPDEAAELTYYGSEVIHPFTMEQVIRARIPIRIKNVENPKGSGTIIFPDSMSRKGETPPYPPKVIPEEIHRLLLMKPKRPTAVTVKNRIIVLNIHSNRKSLSHGFFAKIFSTLDKWQLAVDLISTSEVHVSMALHAEVRENDLKEAIEELRIYGTVDVMRNMTILSLVGKQMKNMVGIAGKMFSTLAASNVNIEMISQGASEINISCVIDEKDAVRALKVIHDEVLEKP